MAFQTTHKNLGSIRSGVRQEIYFPYDDTVAAIGSMSVSCGCSGVSNSAVNKMIVVTYRPQPVPAHLKGQGFYTSRNYAIVNVTLNDSTNMTFTLSFEATIY